LPSDICSQTATASHFPAFPAPPPKLGYFDMNGDVEVFTQRVTEYLSVTLHNANEWDTRRHGAAALEAPTSCTLRRTLRGGGDLVATLLRQLESAQPWFDKVPEL
jgi:hypothetical protein